MEEWRTITIFISSTFNDMHAERDYLVKYVFPELAVWCEKRRIRLVDIDLRWGVTSEESCHNHALRKCLENIDDTNRFFLCLIGQRRGWVPNENTEELKQRRNILINSGIEPKKQLYSEISEETTIEYPDLITRDRNPALLEVDQSKRDNFKSVTEIEIEHALLAPMYRIVKGECLVPTDKSRTVFFQRIDNFTNQLTTVQKKIYTNSAAPDPAWADRKTEELKADIRDKIFPNELISYSGEWEKSSETPELSEEMMDGLKVGKELKKGRLVNFTVGKREWKEVIIEELQKLILDKYNRINEYVADTDKYANDREQQELFIQTATEGYIHRSDIESKLNDYLSGKINKALLLTAEAGLGKTTLLAQYVKQDNADSRFGEKKGLYRFCGVSDLTSDIYTLWDSICKQIGIETPESYEKLSQNIFSLLNQIVDRGYYHIVIDAVNQLSDGEKMLDWFPPALPAGLKVIFSLKVTENTQPKPALWETQFYPLPVGRLSDFTVKKCLIEQFLRRYLKAFDEQQIADICGVSYVNGRQVQTENHVSDNPLFLKILLHELLFFGSFKQLPSEILSYGHSPIEAFTGILKRLERERNAYVDITPEQSVPFLFGLLAHARNGLSEKELFCCFNCEFAGKSKPQILGTIRFYLRQIRPFIARRDGRVDFLYDEFKLAAVKKYTRDKQKIRFALLNYFHSVCDPFNNRSFMGCNGRELLEYTYHLSQYNQPDYKQLFLHIPYLTARCSYTSIVALLNEMKINNATEKYQRLIFRYKVLLTDYKFALPSLAYFYGDPDDRKQMERLQDTGVLRHTWLKSKALEGIFPESESSEQACCNKTIEHLLTLPSAYCIAAEKPYVAISRGNAAVIINTETMEEYNGSIYTNNGNQIVSLTLSCDGSCIAIGCEFGKGFIYKLTYTGNSLSATCFHSFDFRPTEDDRAVFVFEGVFTLWYQDETNILIRLSLDTCERKIFQIQGDITSIYAGKNYLCYTQWYQKHTIVSTIELTTLDLTSTRTFTNDDVMVFNAGLSDLFILGSMCNKNGYMNGVFDAHLQEINTIYDDKPIAAADFTNDNKVLVIPQIKNMDLMYTVDCHTHTIEKVSGKIDRIRDVFIKLNPDGSHTMISGFSITLFKVSKKEKGISLHISDVCEKEGALFVVSVNDEKQLQLTKHRQNLILKSNVEGEHFRVFHAKNRTLVTDSPVNCFLIDKSEVITPDFLIRAYAVLDSDNDIIYFRNNCLMQAPSVPIDIFTKYQLSIVRIFTFDHYVALTGVLNGDLHDLLHTPYVLYVYTKNSNGTYSKLLERYFSEVYAPIEHVSFNSFTEQLYVIFGSSEKDVVFPSVAYGTAYDFADRQEKYKTLSCPKTKLSAALNTRYFCSCGKGVVTVNHIDDMEYATALFLDEPIRFIRSAEKNGEFFAVSGTNKIITFSIIN